MEQSGIVEAVGPITVPSGSRSTSGTFSADLIDFDTEVPPPVEDVEMTDLEEFEKNRGRAAVGSVKQNFPQTLSGGAHREQRKVELGGALSFERVTPKLEDIRRSRSVDDSTQKKLGSIVQTFTYQTSSHFVQQSNQDVHNQQVEHHTQKSTTSAQYHFSNPTPSSGVTYESDSDEEPPASHASKANYPAATTTTVGSGGRPSSPSTSPALSRGVVPSKSLQGATSGQTSQSLRGLPSRSSEPAQSHTITQKSDDDNNLPQKMANVLGNTGVTYESDSDEEPPRYAARKSYSGAVNKTPVSRQPSASLSTNSSLIADINDLSQMGSWKVLESSENMFKIITAYAKNSSAVNPSLVQVHRIFKLKKSSGFFAKFLPNSNSPEFMMLLWFKTSQQSVQHLGKSRGIATFYDRLCRALPVNPEEMENSFRQIILLCSVNLGKMYKSEEGYQYWSKQRFLLGNDSVKGQGRFSPDWKGNQQDGSVLVPCGATKTITHKDYNLDFNEYMVCDPDRVTISYAVDVEIIPSESSR